mgnify:FL=1
MTAEAPTPPTDTFEDLDPCFRPVAAKYSREMFALVMNAGMAGQAAEVLTAQAQLHGSRAAAHAVGVMAQSFNQLSNAYCKLQGWEAGMLAQCDRDLQLAFAGKVAVAGEGMIKLLNS